MESPAIMGEAGDIVCKEKTKNSEGGVCINGSLSCDEPMEICTENSKAPVVSIKEVDSLKTNEKVPENKVPIEILDASIETMEIDESPAKGDEEEEEEKGDSKPDCKEEIEDKSRKLTNGMDNSCSSDGDPLSMDVISDERDVKVSKNDDSVTEIIDSSDVVLIEPDSEHKENGETCSSPDVEEVINISDKETANSSVEIVSLVTPVKKKPKKPTELMATPPRRSSRNLNKQKSYIEKEDDLEEEDVVRPDSETLTEQDNDPDIEEVTPQDPLALSDPLRDDKENKKKPRSSIPHTGSTIVVSDTKRLVEIAANSKSSGGSGKKEPTLVIIDTNSILSGRGPVPVSVPVTQKSSAITTSFSMMPVALPAQGVYPPNMRATITPIPMAPVQSKPAPLPPPPPPAPILPTLTDDMFVVEAPSFIVPYVYEKPPVKPFKEFVEQIGKIILEERKKELERLQDEQKEKESKEKEAKDKDTNVAETKVKESKKIENGEKEEDEKVTTENKDDGNKYDIKEKVINKEEDKEERKIQGKESSDKDENEVVNDEKNESVTLKNEKLPKDSEELKGLRVKDFRELEDSSFKKKEVEIINVKDDSMKPIDLDELPDEATTTATAKPKSNSYFDNALGQFFINIGFSLVQEFVQTDLLKQQKRKSNREGNTSMDTKMAISSLIKNLEYSKENNEPYKMEQKKCEFCSFKTESKLVLSHHLETPHMRNYVYRCNFCPLEVRSPHDILFHMEAEHNTRGRLERAPAFHQCPNCTFEDNQKGKLSRHLVNCLKKFRPERNLEPPHDWEPPAKIPRVPRIKQTGLTATAATYQALAQSKANYQMFPKMQPQSPIPGVFPRGRGRPSLLGKINSIRAPSPIIRTNMMYRPSTSGGSVLVPSYQFGGNQLFQVMGGQSEFAGANRLTGCPSTAPIALIPNIASASSTVTIQSTPSNKSSSGKVVQQPSISITPLPRQSTTSTPTSKPSAAPGAPSDSSSKATFVICEICDGYIKDLEQLRNHMQWIHKVKIHPKMIYNRPPLNCQKCQFRFFTDQGLERHLLGSHGLVTSSMQEAANKSKDAGRCPVCGRVYQWKLLNHVARDHNMTLKPAHLSYKCTVCTATFGMYKQFENHVYSAHSVVAKRVMEKKASSPASRTSDSLLKPLKINDEITIIPQPAKAKTNSNSATSSRSGSSTDRGK